MNLTVDALDETGASLMLTGELETQPIPFLYQLFHTDPSSGPSGYYLFSISIGCNHQHVPPRLSPEMHVFKLTEVVYGAQTASSWGSSVPESFVKAVRD